MTENTGHEKSAAAVALFCVLIHAEKGDFYSINAELTGAPLLRTRVERLVGLLEFY